MPRKLTDFFCPKSVAVLGASRSPEKVGSIILRNIINSGYKGKIVPINPNADFINDLPCFRDIASLPIVPDLIISALPAGLSVDSLVEIGKKGIKNVVVLAAGFKETGAEGKVLEDKLIELSEKYEINILGPNCLGFVNNELQLNATFGQPVTESGSIKFISQSGAVAASIFDWATSVSFGFSEFITLGNKSILNENDILNYFLELSQSDPTAHWPIGMYLESISGGEEFVRLCTLLSKKHPLFVIKPGKTQAAANAMKSHTGAMAGQDDVLEVALKQSGVIRCQTLEDFFDLARGFSWSALPQGSKVAVVSNAGGPGVITADSVVLEGLELAQMDDATKTKLYEFLPHSASVGDPVDVLGDALAERYGKAAEVLLNYSGVDALLFILTPQLMTQVEQTAELISSLAKKYNKPMFCSFIGGEKIVEGEKLLNKNHIPTYRYPERAVYVISQLCKYQQFQNEVVANPLHEEVNVSSQNEDAVKEIIKKAVEGKYKSLDNVSADFIVKSFGINTPDTCNVCSLQESQEFARRVGWPVVLKISSNDTLHKKKLGGVITGVSNENDLEVAFQTLQHKTEELSQQNIKNAQIQIQQTIKGGVEVIVGVKNDPTFGYILMFGAGGSLVELINDKNLALFPMSLAKAKSLVENSKIYKLLASENYDLSGLYDLIVRVSKLPGIIKEAREIEINPVIITKEKSWAVDTKIVMNENSQTQTAQTAVKASGPKYKVAKTTDHINLASKFYQSKFETTEPFTFKPGQYISVKVADTAVRAYSIATRYDDYHFDLLVDSRPGGPGSQYFENLKPGDQLQFLGPFGRFVYTEDDGAEDLLFFATGSGVSAIRCMVDYALQEKGTKKKLKFYFGLTSDFEVFWREHFAELSIKYPNFSFEIALSKPSDEWAGARGFVTELVKRDYPNASKCAAYMCGHPAMLASVTEALLANGCPQERIYSEKF